MEAVHQVMEGKVLSQVITLPKSFHNVMVEVTVAPVVNIPEQSLTRNKLRNQLGGSNTESLSGVLRSSEHITLEEIRAERRIKYERVD